MAQLGPTAVLAPTAKLIERIWGFFLMSVEFASRDLAAKYDRFARWYDSVEGILDFLGVGKFRRAVFSEASGKVLEIAVGTGRNFYYYRSDCQIIAGDLSREMLKAARKHAKQN